MNILIDENILFAREAFSAWGETRALPGRAITREAAREADWLLIRSVTRVDADLLEGSRVRFVATATAGVDHVDVDYLRRRGIAFAHAPGSNADAVADYVVAALVRQARRENSPLQGRALGVIGFGEGGSRVASRARSLGMRMLANAPPLARSTGHPRFRPLRDVLAAADVVTLHVPLIDRGPGAPRGMAGEEFFERMRPGALFINASRGDVVDESALSRALDTGRARAAILDVWAGEPLPDPALVRRALFATPHLAGYSLDAKAAGTRMIYEAAQRLFGGGGNYQIAARLPVAPVISLFPEEVEEPENALAWVDAALRRVCDVEDATERFRAVLDLPDAERSHAFDRLRAEQNRRREIYATPLRCDSAPPSARGALAALGFRLV